MTGKRTNAAGEEISTPGLVLSLVVLGAGALALGALPLLTAFTRLGLGGTALFLLGIVVLSVAFFRAYEHLKPSSPPTPRRDLVLIVFAALLIALWTFLFSNEVVAVLLLAGLAAIALLPDDWRRPLGNHLPRR